MSHFPQTNVVRTTLAIPGDLLAAIDRAVREGKVKSRNEFVALALRHELAAQKRAEIDAAFTEMAQDGEYQAEAEAIAREFDRSAWEAFELGEAKA